jgi:hypothetical protein
MRYPLLLLMLLGWWPLTAASQPSVQGAAYAAVLDTYADDPSEAIRAFTTWTRADVQRGIRQLPHTSVGSILRTGGDRGQRLFKRMALLHTETALAHYSRNDRDSMNAHLEWSRRVVRHELPWPTLDHLRVPAIGPAFKTEWALTIAGFFHTRLAFAEARRFLDEELRVDSENGRLLLARGMTEEIAASERARPLTAPTLRPGRPSGSLAPRPADQMTRTRRAALDTAAAFYRRAIAADPSLHEARLRLGRVLFDRGDVVDAQLELERTQAQELGDDHHYLVSLFLAAVCQRNGRMDEAAQHFRLAAAFFPSAQAPYLGLSQLQALSDPTAAGDILRQMFGRGAVPTTPVIPDPWWLYDAGFGASLPARVERLRAEARAP